MAKIMKSKKSVKEVSAHVHKKARRKNIPTAELQDFVKEDNIIKLVQPLILGDSLNMRCRYAEIYG